MGKLITIVVPVYNVENYIERCVNSLVNQTFSDFDIVLVDDGSKDKSGDLCDMFEKQYNNITVIHKENGGLASARNAGLEACTGEYVMFIDSDDWIETNALESLVDTIKRYKRPDVIKYGYKKICNGEILFECVPELSEKLYSQKEILEEIVPMTIGKKDVLNGKDTFIPMAWSSLYRTNIIKDNEIQFVSEREILNEDYLFALQVALVIKSLYVLKKTIYYYDLREGSYSNRYRQSVYERKLKLKEAYENVLYHKNVLDKYQMEMSRFWIYSIYCCIANECAVDSGLEAKIVIKNIGRYLKDKEVVRALKNVDLSGVSARTRIICFLMKIKAAGLIHTLYNTAKRRQKR